MPNVLPTIRNKWLLLTFIFLVIITFLSLWPLDELPSIPGTDKTHHVIAYALLMLPTALRKPDYWKYYGMFFVFYGGIIELLQPYVNRYGEWNDMVANAAGVICGIMIAELINAIASANP